MDTSAVLPWWDLFRQLIDNGLSRCSKSKEVDLEDDVKETLGLTC